VIHRTARHTAKARGLAALPAASIPAVARILAGPAGRPAPVAGPLPTVPLLLPGLRPAPTAGVAR
jgi:hypothetical protein